ncbi:MAG TPA: ABC transporter permease [Vicinamibacterales bacterium]|nr:ABC transporter permease [Vicinamibacterales bacterium]
MNDTSRPPRLARRLLERALPGDAREHVLGDLEEVFRRDCHTTGPVRARVRYWVKAVSFTTGFIAERWCEQSQRRSRASGPNPTGGRAMRFDVSWMDVKLALRMLIKYPGLTFVSTLGMAVAIAIGATLFSFSYSYLFPTLPLDEGDRIVGIENWDSTRNNQEHRSLHDFGTWRTELTSLRDVGAFRTVRRNLVLPGVPTEQVVVAEMTASGFSLARVPVMLGRPLLEADERKGGPAVVVIGHDVWQNRFGSSPAVIGKSIRLGAVEHDIVGVMPKGFAFPLNHSFWGPLRADPIDYERRQGPEIFMFARLAPGATREHAQAELTAIGLRAAEAFPETNERLRPLIVRFENFWADDITLGEVNFGLVLVSLLLVVVGVNVAILVYARTATRHGEIVVRTALGASRRRIVLQLFIEALVLSSVASVAGLLLTTKVLGVLDGFLTGLSSSGEFGGVPFWVDHRLSLGTMLYVAGLAILAAAIAGIIPALKATGRRIQSSLRDPGGTNAHLGRTWTALIVAEVAFSVAILPGSVFFAWQSIGQTASSPGFAADRFLTTRLLMDADLVPSARADAYAREFDARYEARVTDLIRRAASEPDVSAVTIASNHPGVEYTHFVEIEGATPSRRSTRGRQTRSIQVDAGFFEAFDVSILMGRAFRSSELNSAAARPRRDADGDGIQEGIVSSLSGVIVNRTFVRQFLSDGGVLGRRLRYVDNDERGTAAADGAAMRWHEIVGVVGDLPANPVFPGETEARVYHLIAPGQVYPSTLTVRLRSGDPAAFGPRLREIAVGLDPTLRLDQIVPLTEIYRRQQLGLHMGALAFALVALSVVLLSAAGIYALMSFTITRRQREIGIRAALGAHPRQLLASIFARALKQLALGIVAGVAASAVLDRLAEGDLMAGHATVLLPLVAMLMIVVGLAAAIGPARRGLRIQPTEALRDL